MVDTQKNNLFAVVESLWSEKFPDHFSFEVGLSGGIDSVVLLDVMYHLSQKYGFFLSAVHVHHGLQSEADSWVDFCTKICAQYAISLRIEHIKIDTKSSLGIEAEARQGRYRVFQNSKRSVIVLAHHQDDQIETFLLAVLRGGGLRGMAAMPELRELSSDIFLWRPLLSICKSEIINYAKSHALTYIEDPSNIDTNYTRNWVRTELLPILQNKVQFVGEHILQNIISSQDALTIIDELVLDEYIACTQKGIIVIEKLRCLTRARMKEVLLYFLKQHHLGIPRQRSINDFTDWLIGLSSDTYTWSVPQGEVHVYNGKIWPWSKHNFLQKKINSSYFMPTDITWYSCRGGVSKGSLQEQWAIRPVLKNDTIHTELGVQSVHNLLKKNKIPKFIRNQWPIIVDQYDRCIIIIGLRIDINYQQDVGLVPCIKDLEIFLTR